jgi:adenylate cyclase, class 2
MNNLEFKAELRDLPVARSICRSLHAAWIAEVQQVDTYYRVPTGRLKKREQFGEPVEYICYERPNRSSPKISHFDIYTQKQALERFGSAPLPIWTIVRKTREIFILNHTRIHLDRVESLGNFLELESIVSKQHDQSKCALDITNLRKALAPVLGEAIDCSYSDLLANEHAT